MDLLSRLFIFSPMKENKKFTNVFTRNISELAANISADTVALWEPERNLVSLRGLIH